jgi:hypothetical protein
VTFYLTSSVGLTLIYTVVVVLLFFRWFSHFVSYFPLYSDVGRNVVCLYINVTTFHEKSTYVSTTYE